MMNRLKGKATIFLAGVCLAVFSRVPDAAALEGNSSDSLLPKGVRVEKRFKPGPGASVGKSEQVLGQALAVHAGADVAYVIRKGFPVYKGDQVIAMKGGRIRLKFNDGSLLTLTSLSSLKIDQSVYMPERKKRSFLLSMKRGKARVHVTRLARFDPTAFKIKTGAALIKVTGSEFILDVDETGTRVVALENTTLKVFSLSDPGAGPAILKDYQETGVPWNGPPSAPAAVARDRARLLAKGFDMGPSSGRGQGPSRGGTGPSGGRGQGGGSGGKDGLKGPGLSFGDKGKGASGPPFPGDMPGSMPPSMNVNQGGMSGIKSHMKSTGNKPSAAKAPSVKQSLPVKIKEPKPEPK
ncbi:exported hypothetical protein [Candidatus Desulfarcum epimagneticum]|uniref:FecR protein domain-containing protein n=1 Tax=uncultured Desulfobacteraceae bacterium TaxID=218296 RepID=A0A484HIE9_9BACT|nr:exported hypothetical protein [uncultured Desulfobacteraceae bacterium]